MKLRVCREEEGDFRHEHQQDGDYQQNADNHEHVGDGLLHADLQDAAGGEQAHGQRRGHAADADAEHQHDAVGDGVHPDAVDDGQENGRRQNDDEQKNIFELDNGVDTFGKDEKVAFSIDDYQISLMDWFVDIFATVKIFLDKIKSLFTIK